VREFQLGFIFPGGQATKMDAAAAFQALKHKNVINTQQISGAPTAKSNKWPTTNGLNGQ